MPDYALCNDLGNLVVGKEAVLVAALGLQEMQGCDTCDCCAGGAGSGKVVLRGVELLDKDGGVCMLATLGGDHAWVWPGLGIVHCTDLLFNIVWTISETW